MVSLTPPASARPHKHIHTLRHEEGGAFGAEEGLEFLPHLPVELRGEPVVGVGDADHAPVELVEVFEEAAGVEEELLFQAQAAVGDGPALWDFNSAALYSLC